MEDAESKTDKKNCTFLFKRRKIRSTAARKRKIGNDENGNVYLKNIRFFFSCFTKFIISLYKFD